MQRVSLRLPSSSRVLSSLRFSSSSPPSSSSSSSSSSASSLPSATPQQPAKPVSLWDTLISQQKLSAEQSRLSSCEGERGTDRGGRGLGGNGGRGGEKLTAEERWKIKYDEFALQSSDHSPNTRSTSRTIYNRRGQRGAIFTALGHLNSLNRRNHVRSDVIRWQYHETPGEFHRRKRNTLRRSLFAVKIRENVRMVQDLRIREL